MKENVEELIRLFTYGKNAYERLSQFFETLVPDRPFVQQPVIRSTGPYGLHLISTPEPEPEDPSTVKMLETAQTYISGWIGEVNTILDKTGKARYRLQFEDPKGGSRIGTVGNLTENEEKWNELMSDFDARLQELRRIIIDYETTSEQEAKEVKSKDIEPATYDPKTKTIFFADEAIRFTKSAEYSPAICRLMFEDPDKQWDLKDFLAEWDSLYEYLPDLQKPSDWNKVYAVISKMNDRVQKATGIPDLFKFSTKSVRLNPKYITHTKK